MATETTYTSLRANLAGVLDRVVEQRETVIVRRRGSRDVALIPAGVVHSCNPENDDRWSYQMLYLDPHWVRAVVGEMDSFDAQVLHHLPSHAKPQHLHTRLTELNRGLFGDASVQDKEAALLLFVGDLFGSVQARRQARRLDPTSARHARLPF